MKKASHDKKSTPTKKKGKKANEGSKSRSDKNIRRKDSEGKAEPIKNAKVSKVSKKVQNTRREGSDSFTVSFNKKELTDKGLARLTKDQLLRLARKSFTGITSDFTKSDLIYNIYVIPKEAYRKRKNKPLTSNRRLRIKKATTKEYEKYFTIELSEETFEGKIRQVKNFDFKGIVETYRNKQKLLPRAYMIILVTSNGTEEYDRANQMSEPQISVIASNIKSDIIRLMKEYNNSYYNMDEDTQTFLIQRTDSSWVFDPKNIVAIHVRFFYAG